MSINFRGKGLSAPHVSHAHAKLTVEMFQQYLNMSNRELARRLELREHSVRSIRIGTLRVDRLVAADLYRRLGWLIDDYVDAPTPDLPPSLKKEVVEFLDSLIQPFKVDDTEPPVHMDRKDKDDEPLSDAR